MGEFLAARLMGARDLSGDNENGMIVADGSYMLDL